MAEDPLLVRIRHGDRLAVEELCRREWQPLYLMIYRAVRDPSDAQDLTQETFLRSLASLDRYRITSTPFAGFLWAVARNLLRDHWRRKVPSRADLEQVDQTPSLAKGPEEQVLADFDFACLQRAFVRLRDDYQIVLRLRILEGRSVSDTAALMGRNPAAIRQLQHRALAKLRDYLQAEDMS